MAEKIDQSLDDIIKQNKSSRGGRGHGSFRGREGRGGRIPALISPTGGRRARGGGRNNLRQSPYFRENTDGSWNYDLPAKLIIKNLDFAVTAKDVHELFSDHPNDHRQKIRLIRVKIHTDKSGRSLGSAEIVFALKSDAIKAMQEYNGVTLDGRPMHMYLAESPKKGVPRGGHGT